MTQPVVGTFTAQTASSPFQPIMRDRGWMQFNLFLRGTGVATIQLERSPDGTNWYPITAAGLQLYAYSYTGTSIGEVAEEAEVGVSYRLNCTAYTSGTITYRLSQ